MPPSSSIRRPRKPKKEASPTLTVSSRLDGPREVAVKPADKLTFTEEQVQKRIANSNKELANALDAYIEIRKRHIFGYFGRRELESVQNRLILLMDQLGHTPKH